MKQTLSVADFAIILDLLNGQILRMENVQRFGLGPIKKSQFIKEQLEKLKNDPYYQSLLHLKESLQNLSIEVETPNVQIKNGKGE